MLAAIIVILLAGAIGGVVNGMISDPGVILPGKVTVKDGMKVWRLGILGNILIGAVAAFLYWSIYGGGNNFDIMHPPSDIELPTLTVGFSVLTGIGGARWLTNEVDKYVLKKSTAMAMHADPDTTQHVMDASPLDILKMAAGQEAN
jgi:hypothetical protein